MNGSPNLSVRIGQLQLKNPVMPASGTFGYGKEYADFFDLNSLGAVITKTLTLKPRIGSYPQRSTEVPSGLLASIGLQNVGIQKFIEAKLPFFNDFDVPLIVSIGGQTFGEYVQLAKILDREKRVDALELNISCPNIDKGGMYFGMDPQVTEVLVHQVRSATGKALIVKLTPMVTDIRPFAEACQRCGSDAISLINGLRGLSIDIRTRRSRLGRNITGGLTGPAIKPFALYMVWQATKTVDIPVIGIGGISSTQDALEFFIAGASAIEIGTWNFINPRCTVEIINGIRMYMLDNNLPGLPQLIGTLKH